LAAQTDTTGQAAELASYFVFLAVQVSSRVDDFKMIFSGDFMIRARA